MLYRVFHNYSIEGSLYLDSNLKPEQIEDILINIQFMFEELVTDCVHVEETQFIPLLEAFFSDSIRIIKEIDIKNFLEIFNIELFEAREKRCLLEEYTRLKTDPILDLESYQNLVKAIKYN